MSVAYARPMPATVLKGKPLAIPLPYIEEEQEQEEDSFTGLR